MNSIYNDNVLELGELVRYYRKLRNMTQEQLASEVGISRSTLSALESRNIKPSFNIIVRISNRIGMPISLIFRRGHSVLLNNYSVGRTTVHENGMVKSFGGLQVTMDCCDDTDSLIAVSCNGKYYIADKDNHTECDLLLCANKDTGVCFMCKKAEINTDYSFVVAGIVTEDVSECVFELEI